MSLVVQICKGSLWRKCCVICRLICSPVNWTFGNGCRRDVRGGCDLWNFYSESILKWTSVIHLFMHAPEKKENNITYTYTVLYNNSEPSPTNPGCDFNPRMVYPTRVPHPSRIGVGQQCITGNQWYVDREHWSVLTSNRNHPRWPTLGSAEQKVGQTNGGPAGMFLLFFFIYPSERSAVLFDIRPTCSSDEHKSGVECVRELSVIVCSALSDPQSPVSTRGHTQSLSSVSLSLSISVDWLL